MLYAREQDIVDAEELYAAGHCCHREGCDVLDGDIVLRPCLDCGDRLCFSHRGLDDRCLACSWAAYAAGEMGL